MSAWGVILVACIGVALGVVANAVVGVTTAVQPPQTALAVPLSASAARKLRPVTRCVLLSMATAIAFAFVTDRIGAVWWLPAYLVATIGMIAVSATDFECGRIPNRIIWPTILTTAALLLLASAATGHWRQFVLSVGTALVESAFMLLIRQVRHGMGLGDVRLAGLCGLAAGWLPHGPYLALVGLFIGFVLAAVMSVVKMAAQHSGLLTTTLRIGPYLASGTLIAILWHPALVAA